jgi:hypothetical protein
MVQPVRGIIRRVGRQRHDRGGRQIISSVTVIAIVIVGSPLAAVAGLVPVQSPDRPADCADPMCIGPTLHPNPVPQSAAPSPHITGVCVCVCVRVCLRACAWAEATRAAMSLRHTTSRLAAKRGTEVAARSGAFFRFWVEEDDVEQPAAAAAAAAAAAGTSRTRRAAWLRRA